MKREVGVLLSQEVRDQIGMSAVIPAFPARLTGRFIQLEPVDIERDTLPLFQACNGTGPNGEPDAYDPDELIWRYMFGGPYYSLDDFGQYMAGLTSMGEGLALCVTDLASGRRIGVATYCNNAPAFLSIELGGVWYGPAFQRTYANTETVYLLLKHAFESLNYRRLEWKCDALNSRSRQAGLKLGFVFEGIFRQHMIIKGRNRDTAWYSMIDSEWPSAREMLQSRLYGSRG